MKLPEREHPSIQFNVHILIRNKAEQTKWLAHFQAIIEKLGKKLHYQAVHDSNNTQKYIIHYSSCILNLSALTWQNARCQFSERDLCLFQLDARLCSLFLVNTF